MSRRIPQAFIDELIARADIVDIVGSRVSLKKSGRSHKGLCPFHDEKTPSFIVTADKNIYKCFGCGEGGNAISFLMAYDNLSFPEAIEALADRLGLEMPIDEHHERTDANEPLYRVLAEADRLYRARLRDSEAAIAYLKQRGLDGQTAALFGIGYAPDAWTTVCDALGATTSGRDTLLKAGLVKQHESGRIYDRFRDRIMLPIRDPRGRVLGFGGRVMGAGEPKYLNSPETPVFDKSRILYGLYEARQRPGRPETIIVVEGYLDVAALAQHGVGPAVATLGTAATAHHIRQLTRLCDRVVFCFDGDRAGRAAAGRALETALPFGGGSVEIKFLLLPDGEDPDSFVRDRGPEAFEAAVAAALPLSTFMLEHLAARADLKTLDGRAKLIELARPLLARLPEGVYRQLITSELAGICRLSEDRFSELLDASPNPPPPRAEAARRAKLPLVRKAIVLLLNYPAAASSTADLAGIDEVEAPGVDLLRRLLETAAENPQITAAQLIERFREDAEGRYLTQLVGEAPLDDAAAAPQVLRDALERIVANDRHRRAVEALRSRGSRPADPA